MKIFDFFKRRRPSEKAVAVYERIVAQARQPAFYRDLGVPDTVDGRFDMIILHLILLFHRFRTESEAIREFGQEVFDVFCTDMDRSIREMGAADVVVPKRIKKMMHAFYGRLDRYVAAIDARDLDALQEGIRLNVFADAEDDIHPDRVADYALQSADLLKAQSVEALIEGMLKFADPMDFTPSQAT